MDRNTNKKTCRKKVLFFLCGGVLEIICYLVFMGIYTCIASDPIIFVTSIVIALISVLGCCMVLIKASKDLFDHFTLGMIGLVYFMGVMIMAIFGPTFIDRSISYHIAFYASDMGEVNVEDIREEFSVEIFNKRIHDAVETGFIEQEGNVFVPTWKAKLMTAVLKPLGKITNSLDTYNEMKYRVEKNTIEDGG